MYACRVVQIIQQAWPFIGQYLEKLLVETVAPAIRASSIHLQTLSFTKVNIGDKVRACACRHKKRAVSNIIVHSRFNVGNVYSNMPPRHRRMVIAGIKSDDIVSVA